MEVGNCVITKIDKYVKEGNKEIFIPKGTVGSICEINSDYALIEIWGKNAPKGVEGVFFFDLDEIEKQETFSNFHKI